MKTTKIIPKANTNSYNFIKVKHQFVGNHEFYKIVGSFIKTKT